MDAITAFGIGAVAGAALNGIYGYLNRDKGEAFSPVKFSQTVIVGLIAGGAVATAAVGTINPEGSWLMTLLTGLGLGYGVDAGRNELGLKK